MRTTTCIMGGPYVDRDNIKQFATARQKRQALRLELAELEQSARAGGNRASILRAQIAILDDVIGSPCE